MLDSHGIIKCLFGLFGVLSVEVIVSFWILWRNIYGFITPYITVNQRTKDIDDLICEVGIVSKDAITGQYFSNFLSLYNIFYLKQISVVTLIH